jgi:2-polyprenyl-6-methoxyphenol hydroxylase-like FAD-dependent oxidoreductase
MKQDVDVIIVGGAVAGASAANALGQLGVRTLVIEKGLRHDTSTRGDVLHPPSLRFLDRWEVLDALHRDGTVPIRWLAVSQREMGRLATYPIPPQGEGPAGRTIAAPHDRIERVLLDCAAARTSVAVEETTVTGLVHDEDGRVCGVRARARDLETVVRAPLVLGCDGGWSLVRREMGVGAHHEPYSHELLYIAADGDTDPPHAMHYHLADRVFMVASRPRNAMRIAIRFERGERGDLLKRGDSALREFVVSRVPPLAAARFDRDNVHLYPLIRLLAHRFSAPGVALVGDAAHSTHPTGSTGMTLAICGAARLTEEVGPVLLDGVSTPGGLRRLDQALDRYDAERRPAAAAALEANHRQALRLWGRDAHLDPRAHAQAVNPASGWGASHTVWGADPAGLAAGSAEPS